MEDCLFYVFAALSVLCGALIVLNRNPVNSAMFLVLSIASLAGLFVLLHAFFLAAVQVLVYAGAVMVLFLFVIMLLDLRAEERRKIKSFGAVTGGISLLAIAYVFYRAFTSASSASVAAATPAEGGTAVLGKILFTQYLLPSGNPFRVVARGHGGGDFAQQERP